MFVDQIFLKYSILQHISFVYSFKPLFLSFNNLVPELDEDDDDEDGGSLDGELKELLSF